jgi:hypothetical protein
MAHCPPALVFDELDELDALELAAFVLEWELVALLLEPALMALLAWELVAPLLAPVLDALLLEVLAPPAPPVPVTS